MDNRLYETLPDGLIKDIATNMVGTAMREQPMLSVGAALTLLGTLMAHKYATPTDLRSNIYIVCLAGSGSGKDHPRKYIKKILSELEKGHVVSEDLASGTGLIKAISLSFGIKILLVDEFGRFLKEMNSEQSGSWQRQIITELMKLFTSANSIYHGKVYASTDENNPPITIVEPCVSLYASTVSGHFYDSLSSSDSVDGNLARILFINAGDTLPKRQRNRCLEIYPEIIEQLNELLKRDDSGYNLVHKTRYDDDAQKRLDTLIGRA